MFLIHNCKITLETAFRCTRTCDQTRACRKGNMRPKKEGKLSAQSYIYLEIRMSSTGKVSMNVFDLIKRRRSIRKYKETVVEQERLNAVLEAARLAPSADNKQPWVFIVVTDPHVRERLRSSYDEEWFVKAPVVIVGCAALNEAWRRMDGEEYWKVDVAIAMQNLVLAATELGLGTCWIADFNEKAAKEVLLIPEDVRVVAMTPLGYPDQEKGPVTGRKPLNTIIRHDKW